MEKEFLFQEGKAKNFVAISSQGIILNKNEFEWNKIHMLKKLFQSKANEISSSLASMITRVPYNNEKTLYQLQTDKGKYWTFEIKEKEKFEEAIEKLGKKNLFQVKEIKNNLSKIIPLGALIAFF
ncbi:MAG: hypothetical protein COT90_02580 [Candidatus Diapherotrites archaeon CG10_big_fil_rev_8_21_14_0_10_31_34]|nr:MAG: hypothetical protein COT90_02580 [Candidatus Diapherotrites archaeon CG10_big_fil_rev_8_21_14_0_10_31_34]